VHAEYCTPDYGVVFGPSTDVLDRLTFSFIAAIIIQRSDHYIYIFFYFMHVSFAQSTFSDVFELIFSKRHYTLSPKKGSPTLSIVT